MLAAPVPVSCLVLASRYGGGLGGLGDVAPEGAGLLRGSLIIVGDPICAVLSGVAFSISFILILITNLCSNWSHLTRMNEERS